MGSVLTSQQVQRDARSGTRRRVHQVKLNTQSLRCRDCYETNATVSGPEGKGTRPAGSGRPRVAVSRVHDNAITVTATVPSNAGNCVTTG